MATKGFGRLQDEALEPQAWPDEVQTHGWLSVLWLTFIFWGSNFLLQTLGTALARNPRLVEVAAVRLATTLLGLSFCLLIHLLLVRLATTRDRLIALAIAAPIAAEIFAWTVFFADAAVDPTVRLRAFSWNVAVRTVSFWTWYFLAWAGFYLALSYSLDVQNEQRRAAELRERAHAAQLRALHSQINPHFLFNSLNSVSSLILDSKVFEAEQMVTKLAHFLRLGLGADPTRIVPLSTELELQRTYLEIEQLRYEDLQLSFDVPSELETALVPALILQPIIENAIKYGVANAPPPGWIRVTASEARHKLRLEVVDSGKGEASPKPGSGIGLSNVRQRLALLYGEHRSSLDAKRREDGSFAVELSLPLEFA